MENTTYAREVFGWNVSEEFAQELDQMKLVAEADAGGSYEWDIVMVFWHTGRKRFYWIDDSGCSCNWISDGVGHLGDFLDSATKGPILEYIRQNYSADNYGWTQDAINRLLQDIINWKGCQTPRHLQDLKHEQRRE